MRRHVSLIAGVVFGLVVLGTAGGAYVYSKITELNSELSSLKEQQAAAVQAGLGGVGEMNEEQRLTQAIAEVTPAVVSIEILKKTPEYEISYLDPFGGGFRIPTLRREGERERRVGAGTGFLVSAQGHLVTNKHVVSDDDARYLVSFADGKREEARVLYRDESADIAVLKIDGDGYEYVRLNDQASVQLGQTVFAVGNALGQYDNSVSVGIVSGLNRTVEALGEEGIERLSGVIQTDAAINLGNSGGPLVSLDGTVVGVNVAVARGSENIAFAIPIAEVRRVLRAVL